MSGRPLDSGPGFSWRPFARDVASPCRGRPGRRGRNHGLTRGAPRSWDVIGGPGSWLYQLFDRQRQGLNRRLARYLASRTGVGRGSLVLEAGSGPGSGSSALAGEPWRCASIALDLDADALREARRRDPNLLLVRGDLQRLPFADEAMDLVWSSSTIEHLPDPDAAVGEMRRVAKPEGYVFLGVPSATGPLGFQRWIAGTPFGVWIGTVFTATRLRALAGRAGLACIDLRAYYSRCFLGALCRRAGTPQSSAPDVAFQPANRLTSKRVSSEQI